MESSLAKSKLMVIGNGNIQWGSTRKREAALGTKDSSSTTDIIRIATTTTAGMDSLDRIWRNHNIRLITNYDFYK